MGAASAADLLVSPEEHPLAAKLARNTATKSFTFIDESKSGGSKSPHSRAVIRSHVMRVRYRGRSAVRMLQKAPVVHPRRQRSLGNLESNKSNEGSWDEAIHRISNMVLARSWKNIGYGVSDPFAAAAVPIDALRGSLLQFYVSLYTRDWPQRSAYGIADWMPFTVGDQATVYAECLVAASCLVQRMQKEDQARDWRVRQASYKAEACRLINNKLSDAAEATTDTALQAVALLAVAASAAGSVTELHTHLSGLKRMVTLRGGLSFLDFRVARFISILDIRTAMTNMTQPYFLPTTFAPEPYTWDDSKLLLEPEMTTEIPTLFGFTSPGNPLGLPADLRTVMSRLRIITVLREAYRDLSTAEAAGVFVHISTQQLCLEKHLLKHLLLPLGESVQQLMERCCYLAALMFISTRLSPRTISYHPAPIRALWECVLALRRTDQLQYVELTYDLYLSCLFMGAHAAWGLPERPRFVTEIGRVARLKQLTSWCDVEPRLRDWFYLPNSSDEVLGEVWDEIEGTP